MAADVAPEPEERVRAEFDGPSESPPAAELLPPDAAARRLAALLPPVAAFALAILVRLLAFGLPIEGDPVAYGALAHSIAHGDGYSIDGAANAGYAPAHPALLALVLLFGGTVTSATRGLGLLLAGVVAALLVSIALRLSKPKPTRALLVVLVVLAAAHPALALFAGGLVPGAEATGIALLLAAFRLSLLDSARGRRIALVLTGLLPLVRLDLVAFPIAAAWRVHRSLPGSGARGRNLAAMARARAPALAALFLPLLVWGVRTFLVSGRPFGPSEGGDGSALAHLPRNVLVLAALVLPAAGLGLLWIFVPAGLRRLWNARASDRGPVRTALAGVALHLTAVAAFAGPLAFASDSLRFGLAATPFVVLAAYVGLTTRPASLKPVVAGATSGLCLALSIWLLGGAVQRALPFRALAAGRLHLLAEAYDLADKEAEPAEWIALDLAPRTYAGVEVFLGDRAPSRRTGVVAAAATTPGVFPSPAVLPLRDGLGGAVRCWLVSDLVYDGVIFTGERKDLGRGGQGIFLRNERERVSGGSAGAYTIHQVIRPK